MAITPSPLRYPGGKTAILPMVSTFINDNNLNSYHYVEPYAGGAGLALSLLFKNYVSHIHLNDLDLSIWSFWHSILFKTDDFIGLINSTEITINEWHKQKYIQTIKNDVDTLTLGFSTFFLNRTNRSGIIQKAGVIGGLEQKSKYPLDCRFNKKSLISKIEKIAQYKEFIHLYNMDAINFIGEIEEKVENRFFCIDPPYFKKGQSLYTNFYSPDDHEILSEVIKKIEGKWILTYDNTIEIKKLYSSLPQYNFNLNYTAAEKRKGTELLITCPNFIISHSLNLNKAG
ncbi:DNA adenine methylase [Acinetobacter higginsii]|uniref:DNA adenine methylase n=1 Tax=Acinetobacter higginsii TaxID=70347 RepID=UPI001F6056A7|nr:DNA adenine methylase [Acinetobacter higginsii]MCI3878795.1 DNA adenine methylase [Acinetobacter higginsii]